MSHCRRQKAATTRASSNVEASTDATNSGVPASSQKLASLGFVVMFNDQVVRFGIMEDCVGISKYCGKRMELLRIL